MYVLCVSRNHSKKEWAVIAVGGRSYTKIFHDYERMLDFLREEGNNVGVIKRIAICDYFGNTTEAAMQRLFAKQYDTHLPVYNVQNESSGLSWLEDALIIAIEQFSEIVSKISKQ